ncbi:MAG: trypsin-like peptidase domain-containing protein [Patescibacteria group bacterium]|nr:trypsin-like peptidase domain-containing protein [Patescibacteria group bacterium]MDD5294537.1 trypsin-like peptidase domain-containing protein [Patescibacteria group bacterium]MDD5554716.1 trypsin-like peptidase domain-containing protein [Patescibacteria group bacterium]
MKSLKARKLIICFFLLLLLGIGINLSFSLPSFNLAGADNLRLDDQEATILAIKKVMPAVVSIIVSGEKQSVSINLSTGEKNITKQKAELGSGTGFLISSDGLILTNKHVVNAGGDEAEFRIILSNGKKYYAQLIGKDPLKDLAVLKIFDKDLPYIELGDSDSLQVGASVIAIGNALGLYQNSVTKGIVSALGRSLVASDQAGNAEALDNVIQTDAEINLGNSGGPLVDLNGKVIGINVAIDLSGSSIGFAIPVNDAKPVIKSVREIGRIVRPRLGVLYQMITPEIKEAEKLPRDSGALLMKGEDGSPAVLPDSPAAKAELAAGDIIFEVNAIKVDGNNTLLSILQKYKPGDKIGLKIQRGNDIFVKVVVLDEFK